MITSRFVTVLLVVVLVSSGIGVGVPNGTYRGDDGGGAVSTTDSSETVTVTGRVFTSDGDPAVNDTIVVQQFENRDGDRGDYIASLGLRTNSTGGFSFEAYPDFQYKLSYYQVTDQNLTTSVFETSSGSNPWPQDGSPDIFSLGEFVILDDRNLGVFSLPTAYWLFPTANYSEPNEPPFSRGTFSVRHQPEQKSSETSLVSIDITKTGFMQLQHRRYRGIEVADNVEVELEPVSEKKYVDPTQPFRYRTEQLDMTEDTGVSLYVDPNDPPGDGNISVAPQNPSVGELVTLDTYDISDPNGDSISSVWWDYEPDGNFEARGSRTTYRFQTPGQKIISANISDEHGLNASKYVRVEVTESAVEPVSGSRPPTDPDADSQFEDVNGDGSFSFVDVIALVFADFSRLNDDPSQRVAFDFNGDGRVAFTDVIELVFQL